MSGSCHLNRASNVEIGVECQIFVIVIFFNCGQVLQFGAYSRYYKGALTQNRSFLVIYTTFRSDFRVGWKNQNKHSTLDSSFNALSKWHEPEINQCRMYVIWWIANLTKFRILKYNICYCLLSAPQNQFKTEKKRVWLANFFCWTNQRFIFSVKKKQKQIFVLQNSKFCQISKSPDNIQTTQGSKP